MISKKDLDRGYSDTGIIPEIGDNVFNPESVAEEKAMEKWETKWNKEMGTVEENLGEGGFMDRDDCGYER